MRGLSPKEFKSILLSVGSHRAKRPYSPLEVARCFKKALDAGASLRECAEAVHFDGTSMVSRFLRLLELNPGIQELIDWGQSGSTIAFTAASQLVRLNLEDQTAVCKAVLQNQLSSSEVKQLVQIRLRSKNPIDDCIKAILGLRPQVERRHLFVGKVISEALSAYLSNLTQSERDQLLCLVLKEQFPNLSEFACRLGVQQFTITGDDRMAEILTHGQQDFESVINASLLQRTKKYEALSH